MTSMRMCKAYSYGVRIARPVVVGSPPGARSSFKHNRAEIKNGGRKLRFLRSAAKDGRFLILPSGTRAETTEVRPRMAAFRFSPSWTMAEIRNKRPIKKPKEAPLGERTSLGLKATAPITVTCQPPDLTLGVSGKYSDEDVRHCSIKSTLSRSMGFVNSHRFPNWPSGKCASR